MPRARTPRLSRRSLLGAGGALGAGALLAACGGGSGGTADSGGGQPEQGWSFTDDRGEEVSLDARPERIVAFTGTAAALYDFGLDRQLVGVFGETTRQDGTPDALAGELDVDTVEVIGNAYGEFSIEKYAALRPDLLVTHQYEQGDLWYVPEESRSRILELAPALVVDVDGGPLPEPIQRYAELAAALGADLKATAVTEAKKRFEQAAESVRQAAKASGGLRVLAASGAADTFYASNPDKSADLMYYKQLGVRLIQPDNLDDGDYFESLSWENADKYAADLIILDSRTTALQPDALSSKPAWRDLPAVRAGQVSTWDAVPRFSWAGSAPLLETLAEALRTAKKLA
ncbi:ABC transporter substrate-binding protein [Streptomyces sp. TRM 70351]|uniref:ABC transporter substrate-binding protein n=1 Tax=Streptomyces sp. TRM 70351 TaxID=3116552 RepID=UPI002E7B7E15|nr:ABC transporter substrate-binding protein [Streptomyces sp. TRM 70351]MEE1929300.1 ABC transporter substrate-binding protein [Streptomyces sp. TRM 70351]